MDKQPHWRSQQRYVWLMFMLPALIVYTVFMAYPLLNSMRLSLYTGTGLRPDHFVGFDNYHTLFTHSVWSARFFGALKNTFIFFGIHMLVQNTLGLLFASILSSGVRGASIYRTIIFAPATLSVLVTGFLWTLILNPRWGMFNQLLERVGLGDLARPWLGDDTWALPAISLVSSWQWVGLPTMLFLAGFLNIPEEVLEASRVDGANWLQTFIYVKLPLLFPVIGLVSILTFIGNFNAFDVVYAMTSARGDPAYSTDLMATFFYRTGIAGEHPVARPDMGLGAAVATITFLILMSGVLLWLVLDYYRRRQIQGA